MRAYLEGFVQRSREHLAVQTRKVDPTKDPVAFKPDGIWTVDQGDNPPFDPVDENVVLEGKECHISLLSQHAPSTCHVKRHINKSG
jgi:hypothetical protein